MKTLIFRFICLSCLLTRIVQVRGQDTGRDSIRYLSGRHEAVRDYRQFTGEESPLYDGIVYVPYQVPVTGNPFFNSDHWSNGTVFFRGVQYSHVSLLYDIMRGLVIIRSFDSATRIVLNEAELSRFVLSGHTFIHITAKRYPGLSPGYYELLYFGRHEVLASWSKSVQTSYSGFTESRRFDQHTTYFIRMDQRFHHAVGKAAVFRLFGARKNQVRADFRRSRIRYHRDPGAALVRMCSYLDRISP